MQCRASAYFLFLFVKEKGELLSQFSHSSKYLKYLSNRPFRVLPCLASSQAISWTVSCSQHPNSSAVLRMRSATETPKGHRASQLWQPMQSEALRSRAI